VAHPFRTIGWLRRLTSVPVATRTWTGRRVLSDPAFLTFWRGQGESPKLRVGEFSLR
jgi:hypothetical protein